MMSPGNTWLWKDYNDAFELAKRRVSRNAAIKHLILGIASSPPKKKYIKNREELNDLAVLGAINQYFDGTVELTRLGKDIVESIT
jgi:hypothetical protein